MAEKWRNYGGIMADISDIQSALPVKVVGSDSIGAEQTPVQSTTTGGLFTAPSPDVVLISSTTPLGISAAFTSSVLDLLNTQGSELTFGVFADQASAALGFQIQWSHDGTNFDHIENYTLPAMTAGGGRTFTQRKVARYLRVVFTNGAIAQTVFRLTVYMNVQAAKPSSHRLGATLDDNNDAQLVKANVTGRKTDGSHDNVELTNNNDLSVADIVDAGGVQSVIAVGTTPVAVRVGGSNLANRKRLLFINTGSVNLYWGYANTVSPANGMIVYRNQSVSDSWGPNTTIWIVAASGTGGVSVAEAA